MKLGNTALGNACMNKVMTIPIHATVSSWLWLGDEFVSFLVQLPNCILKLIEIALSIKAQRGSHLIDTRRLPLNIILVHGDFQLRSIL